MKYHQEVEGKNGWSRWISPKRKGYKMCCCDCGLVHNMDFKIVGKEIFFRAQRNNRATGQVKRRKLKMKKEIEK